jgi:hypothetical protein
MLAPVGGHCGRRCKLYPKLLVPENHYIHNTFFTESHCLYDEVTCKSGFTVVKVVNIRIAENKMRTGASRGYRYTAFAMWIMCT